MHVRKESHPLPRQTSLGFAPTGAASPVRLSPWKRKPESWDDRMKVSSPDMMKELLRGLKKGNPVRFRDTTGAANGSEKGSIRSGQSGSLVSGSKASKRSGTKGASEKVSSATVSQSQFFGVRVELGLRLTMDGPWFCLLYDRASAYRPMRRIHALE